MKGTRKKPSFHLEIYQYVASHTGSSNIQRKNSGFFAGKSKVEFFFRHNKLAKKKIDLFSSLSPKKTPSPPLLQTVAVLSISSTVLAIFIFIFFTASPASAVPAPLIASSVCCHFIFAAHQTAADGKSRLAEQLMETVPSGTVFFCFFLCYGQ